MINKLAIIFTCIIVSLNSFCQTELFDLSKPNLSRPRIYFYDPDDILGLKNQQIYLNRFITRIAIYQESLNQDVDKYTDSLILDWNINVETNGRFIFYTYVNDSKKVVIRFGSRLEPLFDTKFESQINQRFKSQLQNNMMAYYSGHLFKKKKDPAHLQIFRVVDSIIDKNIAYDNSYSTRLKLKFPSIIIIKPISASADYSKVNLLVGDSLEIAHKNLTEPQKTSKYDEDDLKIIKGFQDLKDSAMSKGDTLDANKWEKKISQYKEGVKRVKVQQTAFGKLYSINDVINQRVINNVWVTNQNYTLLPNEVAKIDAKLKDIERETGYEIAVVVVDDVLGEPFDFGLELFNSWGIGNKETNNGLLITVLTQRHKTVINTGSGTELVLSDAMSFLIQENEMNPYFKNGQFATGILNGLDEIQLIFEGNPSFAYKETVGANVFRFLKRFWIFGVYFVLTILATIYYLIVLVKLMFVRCPTDKYNSLDNFNMKLFKFFPFPFLILKQLNKFLLKKWRNTSRFSTKDGQIMFKLDNDDEKKHLSEGQILEEKLKSIDYDVWVTRDGKDVLRINYNNKNTEYTECGNCGFKTRYEVYDKVISSPSYSSSGESKVKQSCKHCNHVRYFTYTLPQLTYSSSSSSDSDWDSGGGSDWGGGDSSGGGSSSDW